MIDLYAIASSQARKLNVRGQDFDDVVQEAVVAMLRATERINPNRPERSRKAFLKATAHNAAVDFLRWRGRREDAEILTDPSALPSSSASAEDEALANETRSRIEAVFSEGFERMSPRERDLFLEKLGLPPDEDLSGLHSGTRGTYSHRARAKLLAASEAMECQELLGAHEFGVLFAR